MWMTIKQKVVDELGTVPECLERRQEEELRPARRQHSYDGLEYFVSWILDVSRTSVKNSQLKMMWIAR